MRLDLHVHSTHSSDGTVSPRNILKVAKKRGLGGVAITDHNTLKGFVEAKAIEREFDIIVVRGMEISSAEGHVLAYGIDSEVERGMTAKETVDGIKGLGGFASVAHPYRWWSGVGERATVSAKPHAVETMNARSTKYHNFRARRLCKSMKVRKTAGSDAHFPGTIGKAYTIIDNPGSEEDVIEALWKGRVKTAGVSRTASQSLRYGYKAISQWAGRGFRRM